jgi:hypothetical protein
VEKLAMRPFLLPFAIALVLSVTTACRDGDSPIAATDAAEDPSSSVAGEPGPGSLEPALAQQASGETATPVPAATFASDGTTRQAEAPDARELLAQAAQHAEKAQTFNYMTELVMAVELSKDVFVDISKGEGQTIIDLAGARRQVSVESSNGEMGAIELGDICYSKVSLFGDLWFENDCDETFLAADDLGSIANGPAALLALLARPGQPVEYLDRVDLGGVSVHHVRAETPSGEFDDLPFDSAVTADLWVDAQGIPVRLRYWGILRGDEDLLLKITVGMTFETWDEPVDIQPPADDELGYVCYGLGFGISREPCDDTIDFSAPAATPSPAPSPVARVPAFRFTLGQSLNVDGRSVSGSEADSIVLIRGGEGAADPRTSRFYFTLRSSEDDLLIARDGDECFSIVDRRSFSWRREPCTAEWEIPWSEMLFFGGSHDSVVASLTDAGFELEDLGEVQHGRVLTSRYRGEGHLGVLVDPVPGARAVFELWVDERGRPFQYHQQEFLDEDTVLHTRIRFDNWNSPVDLPIHDGGVTILDE